jgi:hypothetical protein
MDQKSSRRQFFTHAASLLGLAVMAPALFGSQAFAEERRRARGEGGAAAPGAAAGGGDLGLPMVEPGKGPAAAVNYSLKHADVKDKALKVDRGGVPFEKQMCHSCSFYTKAGDKAGKEVGKCQIFAGQLVESTAWCSTWNKKA